MLAMITANGSCLELAKAGLRMKLETSPLTQAEIETGLEECDKLREKSGECSVLIAKVGKLEKELGTMHNVARMTERKIYGPELQVGKDAKAIAYLALLVKDHCSNYFCWTVENSELWKCLCEMNGKVREAVVSTEQFQVEISSMTGK